MDFLFPMLTIKKKAKQVKKSHDATDSSECDNSLEEVVRNNEETVERICVNVAAYAVISNSLKIALQSTFDPTTTNGLCKNLVPTLIPFADSCVRDIDPADKMVYVRIKTRNCEYLIGPEDDFTVVVQQN